MARPQATPEGPTFSLERARCPHSSHILGAHPGELALGITACVSCAIIWYAVCTPIPRDSPGCCQRIPRELCPEGKGLSEPWGVGPPPGQGTALGFQTAGGHLVVIAGTHLHPQAVPGSQENSLREGLLGSNPDADLNRQEARNEGTDAHLALALPR